MASYKTVKVTNINGRPNQFEIVGVQGQKYFQSYDSTIIFITQQGSVNLDKKYWDYSRTTGKYRNIFLGETKKETEQKIKSGEYQLLDLNIN
tara:strand:+ start:30 stop:305 length:276 start_codon:yes stop_codon:yes gene_type:complete